MNNEIPTTEFGQVRDILVKAILSASPEFEEVIGYPIYVSAVYDNEPQSETVIVEIETPIGTMLYNIVVAIRTAVQY